MKASEQKLLEKSSNNDDLIIINSSYGLIDDIKTNNLTSFIASRKLVSIHY